MIIRIEQTYIKEQLSFFCERRVCSVCRKIRHLQIDYDTPISRSNNNVTKSNHRQDQSLCNIGVSSDPTTSVKCIASMLLAVERYI